MASPVLRVSSWKRPSVRPAWCLPSLGYTTALPAVPTSSSGYGRHASAKETCSDQLLLLLSCWPIILSLPVSRPSVRPPPLPWMFLTRPAKREPLWVPRHFLPRFALVKHSFWTVVVTRLPWVPDTSSASPPLSPRRTASSFRAPGRPPISPLVHRTLSFCRETFLSVPPAHSRVSRVSVFPKVPCRHLGPR